MNVKTDPAEDTVAILVVEDSRTQAEQLKYLLEQQRYRVMTAENGNQALALLSEHRPTLVITDIIMPEMDGYDLCKRIKSDEKTQEIPVILLTSLTSSEDVLEGLACGADNFITKPYSEEYLLSSIERILAGRKLRKSERVRIGVEISFGGKNRFITADQQQMLSLLVSTYEAAVHRNAELVKTQDELRALNERLEELVEIRTAALSAEIVERKQAEEALRESEDKFKHVFESANVGKSVTLPTGEINVNKAFSDLLGYAQEELRNKTWQELTPPDEIETIQEMLAPLLKGEKDSARFNKRYIHKNGSYIWADVSVAIRRDSEGKPLHFIVTVVDITERKRAEAERERLMAAVEQVGEMIVITDPEGAIQYVNPAFETVTGYTREEALGQNPRILKSGKQDEAFYRELWETISGGRTWKGRIVNKRKDAKLYTEAATISPVCDAAGRVVNYVAVKRDITEHLNMEAQFLQAQKLETVGRLTGGIAHDFNNLLTPIIGNAEMTLSDMSKEDPLYEVMEEIRNAGARAASLTRQLLAFSRRQILQPEIINLNGVVRDMDKMLRRTIGEDIELETILNPELGQVEADVGQMEQILMNLAVNARDAMPKGGKLTIETSNVELDEGYTRNHISVISGPYVMLAVSDTGVGMSKEVQAQLFEPFFTTKEKGKGTGLGLSTVYGIVKQSKGNIWVYSEPGKGSTFKIYLPRVEETGRVMGRPQKEGESLQGSETILVVEDDKMVRNMTLKILQKYGYTVLCARDGQEALHMCREHEESVQLILTDVVMPGMSGRDLAEELKRIQPGMKVLFMSGYTDNAIVHHGILDNGIAFLQKPFTPEGLARKVREVLDA